ncbi:hypothetical protein BD414DRAFT_415407 [Trametes punicea]|nr:hypothetical protein BD414DRAFT_415407 [Trametes punicea]
MPSLLGAVATLAVFSIIPTAFRAPTYLTLVDPCAKIAGKTFSAPADALACMKSYPFNETLRQNVLTVISRVFDFYTFEYYYFNSRPSFQNARTNIRAEIARINRTHYATDFDFNKDVYDFTTWLNDGHTRWYPNCYMQFQNLLPAPVVTLEQDGQQNVFVAPDITELIPLLGREFTDSLDSIGFDWQRIAGAKVLEIEGLDAYAYAQRIAETETGNFLDLGVRINSAFSSYRIAGTNFSQRFGDISGPPFPTQTDLTMKLIPVNSTKAETVSVPFVANYLGKPFTDSKNFWTLNCAANSDTNGIDRKKSQYSRLDKSSIDMEKMLAKAFIFDVSTQNAVGLPSRFEPTLPPVNGSEGVIKSFILPDNKTGVMFVGSFRPDDFFQFQRDVHAAVAQFQREGVSQLLIDVTNNLGGFICLGDFLHVFLTGSKSLGKFPNPGFQSTNRANTLARKILASDIELGITSKISFYPADNWAFLENNTEMPPARNYMQPPSSRIIKGQMFVESQRLLDDCPFVVEIPEEPRFAPDKIAIIGNGNCASTCAMFSILMNERHNTTIAVFGGKPGLPMQFKGMAGNQVLEWSDIDSEIKTADLKGDPLAPPDLLVSGNFRHNWRIAYSFLDEQVPIVEYKSQLPHFRFPYTSDTYNNPQNLWIFA